MEDVKKRYEEIPIDSIVEKTGVLREIYTQDGMDELRESIRQNGVLEPVLVAECEGGYRIIAGSRRVVCAEAAGLATIPALVVEASESWELSAMWAENGVRVPINALDLGQFIHRMIRDKGLTQLEISGMLGKSEAWVSQRLGVMGWPDDVREAVGLSEIVFGVGRELAAVEDAGHRRVLLRAARTGGCSVRQAGEWRRSWEREREYERARGRGEESGANERKSRERKVVCAICKRKAKARKTRSLEVCEGCFYVAQANLHRIELDEGDTEEGAEPGDVTLPPVS